MSHAPADFARTVAATTVPSTQPVTTRLPTAAVSKPADDFFNVVPPRDNCDRLTLEELSFLLPTFLDEDVFINLSKSRNCTTNSMLCVLEKLPSQGPLQMAGSAQQRSWEREERPAAVTPTTSPHTVTDNQTEPGPREPGPPRPCLALPPR